MRSYCRYQREREREQDHLMFTSTTTTAKAKREKGVDIGIHHLLLQLKMGKLHVRAYIIDFSIHSSCYDSM